MSSFPDLYVKDPGAVLDYKFDWSNWLETGETISTHTVTLASGLTKDSSSITDAGLSVTAYLSGGTAGTTYKVTCQVVTSAATPRTDERTMRIKVRNR